MHLKQGTLLQGGKYRIEKVLGQGGFGITYLAEQVMLGRKVAVKEFFIKELCNRDGATSHVSVGSTGSIEMVERFKEKFLKEARLIAAMDNNHIVRIYDIFEENDTAYYIMENIDGGSVDALVKDRALQETYALKIIKEVGSALEYIHMQNILHLDVKPSNILLRKNGDAVLIDFGISKRYDDAGGQTSTTPVGISKGYAPIEQYNQGLQNFSPATDVYSLGATLFKLLTGQTPPEAPSLLDDDEFPECPVKVSSSYWSAIEKALEPRKKNRYQTVNDFIEALTIKNSINNNEENQRRRDNQETLNEETINLVTKEGSSSYNIKDSKSNLTFTIKGISFNMVKVESGTLNIIETVDSGFLGLSSKKVRKEIKIDEFYIADIPVTQSLWDIVIKPKTAQLSTSMYPKTEISYNDCTIFIQELNKIFGKTFRFPTEHEWVFAAQGGNKSKGFKYSGSNDLSEVGWFKQNSNSKLQSVAQKKPNELGLYDMSGNIWEWCNDNDKASKSSFFIGTLRPKKGGSFENYETFCSLDQNNTELQDIRSNTIGLRLALSYND